MVQDHAKNSDFEQIVCGQSSGIGQSKPWLQTTGDINVFNTIHSFFELSEAA